MARIIRAADTFDALTSTRSYRRAFGLEKALELIRREQGVRIDAEAAEHLLCALEAYRRDEPADFAAQFGPARDPATDSRFVQSDQETAHVAS